MLVRPEILGEVRLALAEAVANPPLAVETMELFFGPSPWSDQRALVCRLAAEGSAEEARTLQKSVRRELSRLPPWEPAPDASFATVAAGLAGLIAARLLNGLGAAKLRWGVREGGGGTATLWVDFMSANAVVQAVKAGLVIVARNAGPDAEAKPAGAAPHVARLKEICAQEHPLNQNLIGAARRRDVPFLNVGGVLSLWQFGWGSRSELFWETSPNSDGLVSAQIAGEKLISKRLFQDLGVPTPPGLLLTPGQPPAAAADRVGWPCVVKPADRGRGKGVTADIQDLEGLERAIALARKYSRRVLVEAHLPGNDHRLMVVRGKLIAAVRRDPPEVVGDGKSTIAELLAALNRQRRSLGPRSLLKRVAADDAFEANLARHGVTRDTVLPEGHRYALRSNANLSTGGTATDVTSKVHPSVRAMAEYLATGIGLSSVGIDYVTLDIARSHAEVGGGIIEVNTTPGLDVLAAAGLDFHGIGTIVLGDEVGRIPVQLLLCDAGSRAKTFAGLAEVYPHQGRALVTTDEALIGGVPIHAQGMRPLRIVEAALRHRSVASLAIVWDHDTLLRFGLPVDRLDQTVILGEAPPPEWAGLLGRLSRSVVTPPDEAEALRLASA